MRFLSLALSLYFLCWGTWAQPYPHAAQTNELFTKYCLGCHEGPDAEGNLDLSELLAREQFDNTLIFENVATEKMPPAEADAPAPAEREKILKWLANQQPASIPRPFRRISRYEFVHSINDLLGTELDLAFGIPEDRGTNTFDSNRRIQLSPDMLGSYFAVADEMLEHALPQMGFVKEQTWVTDKLLDSHETYNIYLKDYKEGTLFSWTRANNGNSYSFFYDNFNPPAAGWYELTFESAKVGDLNGDASLQVHAGKYYYADDRPQPQRLLDVISLGSDELESQTIRAFLRPGENVSVHCFHKDNFREKAPKRGVYIRRLTARGPLQDTWPPRRYKSLFGDLPLSIKPQNAAQVSSETETNASSTQALRYRSNLEKIGGSISVSSFQPGMEKENMLDGSNRTFWHTRFEPTLAKPPHFIVIKNPNRFEITGLSYATWTGGNGNGQVEKFEVYTSENGVEWGTPICTGELETRLANEQPISFPEPIAARFIKLVATESFSLDGRSLASIGKLDVIASIDVNLTKKLVAIESRNSEDLRQVVKRFAERAFSSNLTVSELQPYFDVAERVFQRDGDFIEAAKAGFKAVMCSHRFLLAPGEHSSRELAKKAALIRILWLSVPDEQLIASDLSLRGQIELALADERSNRMVRSLCEQWLNLRAWKTIAPSLKLYPLYDDLLEHYLPLETTAYLAYLIRENRPAGELIDSDYSFLNQRLADHYGIEGILGQHLRRVQFEMDTPRGGLLTMGSVMKVTTDGFQTSPILRGAWISKNILGTPLSPPPDSVQAIEPEMSAGSTSLREQIELHKESQTCNACHKSIDPYGFALENYDATGRWRNNYQQKLPHKNTFKYRPRGYFRLAGEVDSAGVVGDQEFADIHGLKRLLLTNDRKVAYNFAKKFFEYANGYEPSLTQRIGLLEMTSGECRMRDIVINVLEHSLENSAGRGR